MRVTAVDEDDDVLASVADAAAAAPASECGSTCTRCRFVWLALGELAFELVLELATLPACEPGPPTAPRELYDGAHNAGECFP